METIKTEKIGKRKWRLLQSFGPVPKGFITDGASVPRIFWWVASPGTDAFEAAVIHDWYLMVQPSIADLMFFKYLLAYGVPKWRAYLLYWSVIIWFKFKRLLK